METHTMLMETPFNGTQACKNVDPDLFFPDTKDEVDFYIPEKAKAAKAICNTCVMMGQCLEYALAQSGLVGIWGGTDEDERRRLKRRRARNKVYS